MKSSFFLTIVVFVLFATDAFAQIQADVQMDFGGPTEYVVTDSQGKRSGLNPITHTDYDEIPYAGYGDGSSGETREFTFNTILMDTLFSTTYTIHLFGTGNGVFKGSVGGRQTLSGKGASFRTLGVIDSNQTVIYVFNYSTDSTITPTFWKVVTPQIIRQDFSDCFKLKILGNEGFYRDILHQLDDISKDLAHKDSIEARKDLEKFQDELENAHNETIKHDKEKNQKKPTEFERGQERFVSPYAYQILSEDVSLLLQQLPEGHQRDHEGEGRGKN